jgi:hypothetical protein
MAMEKNSEVITHLPNDECKPQSAPAPAAEQQRTPLMMTSSEGPLLSYSVLPGKPLLPGTISQFPQEFNPDKSESDGSGKNNLELDYDATSSEEEKQIEPEEKQIEPLPSEETPPLKN